MCSTYLQLSLEDVRRDVLEMHSHAAGGLDDIETHEDERIDLHV